MKFLALLLTSRVYIQGLHFKTSEAKTLCALYLTNQPQHLHPTTHKLKYKSSVNNKLYKSVDICPSFAPKIIKYKPVSSKDKYNG